MEINLSSKEKEALWDLLNSNTDRRYEAIVPKLRSLFIFELPDFNKSKIDWLKDHYKEYSSITQATEAFWILVKVHKSSKL